MSEEKMIPQKPVFEVLCAIQGALGEENQKVFAKASMTLGKTWGKTVSPAKNIENLMEQIANYLRDDLKLAQNVTVERQGQEYIVKNRGCYICHGKLVKEKYGIIPACAMSMFPVGALVENLKIKNVRLKEIRKPGPIGDCDWVYEIAK
ncbi:MAG TPA: hypothetical protein VLU95_07545 [Candidatus Acidoferrum sp.]|nr:hypothetical protein [Candidatus Acidoferrum sp.]